MGQDCRTPEPPPEGGTAYCHGNDYDIWDTAVAGWDRDGIAGAYSAILQGEPSDNRRSTVQVKFGRSYCSGVVLGPRLVLTAAHCGYGDDTIHHIYFPTRIPNGDGVTLDGPYTESAHLVHPDYLEWVESNVLWEKRHADLMLIYFNEDLPGPYLGSKFYSSTSASVCKGLVAQGLGRWESSGLSLRETKYTITSEIGRLINSRNTEDGKICFGDSGGPLYADVAGETQLAGITSTTMSSDCKTGGSHVAVDKFLDWLAAND